MQRCGVGFNRWRGARGWRNKYVESRSRPGRRGWCWSRERRCCIRGRRSSRRCWRGGVTSSAVDCSPPGRWSGESGSCAGSRSSLTNIRGGGPPRMWRSGPAHCCRARATRARRSAPTRARWPGSATTWSAPTTAGRVSASRGSVLIRCRSATKWNTAVHVADYEGRPARRPFTRAELQILFDFADSRVVAVRERPQGAAGGVSRRDAVQGDLRVGAAPPGGGDA